MKMKEIILHVGAHRTGTTSFQNMLESNRNYLEQCGIEVLTPKQIRARQCEPLELYRERVILSEENFLGTMEGNLLKEKLYPNLETHFWRINHLAREVSVVFLSVRSFDEYWSSLIAFCASRGQPYPTKEAIERIAQVERRWTNVVSDISRYFPNARLVVRDFNWKTGNPKQQLLKVCNWPEIRDLKTTRAQINQRPDAQKIASQLYRRQEFQAIATLPRRIGDAAFEPEHCNALRKKYVEDLVELSNLPNVKLLSEVEKKGPLEVKYTTKTKGKKNDRSTPISEMKCFLHIGKTGGTFFKDVINESDTRKLSIFLGNHGDTLAKTVEEFGIDRKVCFFFRPPEERFVSGFLSRMRQGRPRYDVLWSPGEAVAFSFFQSPNDLAEAIYSPDERLISAARFAFSQIVHLKLNYEHYLTSPAAIRYEEGRGNIIACCETKNISKYLSTILERFGVQVDAPISGEKNVTIGGVGKPGLSEKGLKNLRRFWAREFEIFEELVDVSTRMGFGG